MSTLSVDTIQGKTTASKIIMPEGTMIQFKHASSSTQVSNSTDNYISTSVSISFTPKFDTSLILVHWEGHFRKSTSAGGGLGFNLYKDSSALTTSVSDTSDRPIEIYKDETRIWTRSSKSHCEVSGNTTARTYTCKFKRYDSNSNSVEVNYNISGSGANNAEEILTVMEIAQ